MGVSVLMIMTTIKTISHLLPGYIVFHVVLIIFIPLILGLLNDSC